MASTLYYVVSSFLNFTVRWARLNFLLTFILVKRQVVSCKTTGHFSKNDGSLFRKRRVTFRKRRVVFHRRFDAAKHPKTHRKTHIGNRLSYTKNRICKKSYNRHSTRAYVRAHNKSFLFFAVTSVTRLFISNYIPNDYALFTNKF